MISLKIVSQDLQCVLSSIQSDFFVLKLHSSNIFKMRFLAGCVSGFGSGEGYESEYMGEVSFYHSSFPGKFRARSQQRWISMCAFTLCSV